MTRPRSVRPDCHHFVSRSTILRLLLLRPGARTNRAYKYCLAEAAKFYGIDIVASCAMSNHHHTLIYDAEGIYPKFIARLHRMLAKVMNCHLGRWENFFAAEQTSVVLLVDDDAILEKILYTLMNPVVAGLVAKAEDWPGFTSVKMQLEGTDEVVERPDWFFREKSKMAKQVTLKMVRPRSHQHLSDVEWRELLRVKLAERERQEAAKRLAAGKTVMGKDAVLKQRLTDTPRTRRERRKLKPEVACRNKKRRIEALAYNKRFRAAYAAARAAFKAGQHSTVFPFGTYKMSQLGACCALA